METDVQVSGVADVAGVSAQYTPILLPKWQPLQLEDGGGGGQAGAEDGVEGVVGDGDHELAIPDVVGEGEGVPGWLAKLC